MTLQLGRQVMVDYDQNMLPVVFHFVLMDTSSLLFFKKIVLVFSNNNETVMFKEESTWNSSMHFMGHTNVEFAGTFLRSDCGYYFQGNVSSDEVTDFGTVNFCAVG